MAGPPKAPEPTPSAASAGGSQAGAAPAADEKFAWRQVYHKPDIAGMSALSRREEEALVKDAKAHARDVCKQFVAAYASCVEPRLVSALWACRAKQEEMNACLRPLMTEAVLDRMRMEYLSEKHREAYRQGPGEVRDGSRSPYSGR